MSRRFPHSKWFASFALLSLLFAQMMVSAYACPMLDKLLTGGDTTVTVESSADCHRNAGQANLCQKHCEQGQQHLGNNAPDVPALSGVVFTMPLAVLALPGSAPLPLASVLVRSSSPPLSIRHCCWRI